MKKRVKVAAVLFAGVAFGIFLVAKLHIFQAGCAQEQRPVDSGDMGGYPSALEENTIRVAETVGKAVVSVSVESTEKSQIFGMSPFGRGYQDDFFSQFFGDFFGNIPNIPQRGFKRMGLGSGVIIDKEGYILTNYHVIEGADKIKVKLSDGRKFDGEVKGKDPRSDLAVIKIKAHNLPIAELGDSTMLKTGQWVMAIGNPFGFAIEGSKPTVTAGVVSALNRDLGSFGRRDRSYSDLIQTDAAINPGNSGGPLVDMEGKVIGINVAIVTTSGGYQGLGFAIPINKAKRIMNKLINGEEVLYGWLGVSIQDLNQDLKSYFKLKEDKGAIVVSVLDLSPAKKAGLKEGDLIISFNGKTVDDIKSLIDMVGNSSPGTKITLGILRRDKAMNVKVVLGKRPMENTGVQESASKLEFRGMEVSDINHELRMRHRINEESGVVVTYVKPDSPADKAGIIPSDIILSVEGKIVNSSRDFLNEVKGLKGSCLIRTKRGFFVVKEK